MIYVKNTLTSKRLALIEFGRTISPTHLVTLNFHDHYRREQAELKLGRWYTQVNRRLFRYLSANRDRRIDFIAYPEYSMAGHIHYHAVARIPSGYEEEFDRLASIAWKRIIPYSTIDIRPIGEKEIDIDNVLSYVTKSTSALDVIHSNMLHP